MCCALTFSRGQYNDTYVNTQKIYALYSAKKGVRGLELKLSTPIRLLVHTCAEKNWKGGGICFLSGKLDVSTWNRI